MIRTLFLPAALLLLSVTLVRGDDNAAPKSKPPSAATAQQVLKDSPRHGEWVDIAIPGSDVKLHTWVVYPERDVKAPVVIVIHEIFGMTDWVHAVTDQLAAEGFIAIAPDLLSGFGPGGGGTDAFKGGDVRDAFSKLTRDETNKRLDAVRDYALSQPSASDKSASIGFCWGGGASFAYAAHQPKLNAAVVFYGNPPPKDDLANIQCPVIGFFGKDDNRVTSKVEPTVKAMKELNKPYDVHIYDGAGHGFMRQQDGRDGANQKAAHQAWPETIKFLKDRLQ